MKADPSRSADDGKSKSGIDALLKPLLPSRIPKKPKKSSGRTNPRGLLDLKRPFSVALGGKETDRSVQSVAKVTTLAPSTLLPEKKLTVEATELVSLIPTLSGVDVSCLVASIKRRRLQRTRGGQARTTQRLTECTQPPPSPKAASDPLPVTTSTEETRRIDEKTFQLELAKLKYAMETQPTQKTEEESWSADGGTRSEQAITNEENDLNPPSLAGALTRRATR